MSTFAGMAFAAGMIAMLIDKLYVSLIHSTSAVAEAGRYAAFTGTWTTIGTAIGMRSARKSFGRLKGSADSAGKLVGRTKED